MNDEIRSAVFQIHPFKALGPDGFGLVFFQTHWPLLQDQICLAVWDFFNSGRSLKEFNHTFIALIPKVDNPETTSQFRPISFIIRFIKLLLKLWLTACARF